MKRLTFSIAGLAGVLVLFGAHSAPPVYELPLPAAGIASGLSVDQLKQINKGEPVFVSSQVKGTKWPVYDGYAATSLNPEEAAAVFNDYDLQGEYLTQVKSKLLKRLPGARAHVQYIYDTGFLGVKSTYTTENQLTHQTTTDLYWIGWKMLTADRSDAIEGFLRVEPMGTGSLFHYRVFLIPQVPFIIPDGAVMNRGWEDFKIAVPAIRDRYEKQRNGALLKQQVKALREVLGRTAPPHHEVTGPDDSMDAELYR